MLKWLEKAQITPKGHPLVWFHQAGIPDWLRDKSYGEVKELVTQRVREVTGYYGSRINYYDIMNEANNIPWANDLNYSTEQFLELTNLAAMITREENPHGIRIINHCCLWGENVAYYRPPQQTPYQYLQACIRADIPFEVIGLQLYYPDQDMFEIDRLLERFGSLGKPIHITEIGAASAMGLDEGAGVQDAGGIWRAPWSESIQADWLEQLYTLCYSKSYIKAITWWDFADIKNFWPHGGLLDGNLQPKLSFSRLSRLIRRWQG